MGTDLAGAEVVANFKTPTTRVYVGPPDNIQAQEEVQVHFVSDGDVSAGGNGPPVHVAVTQGTPSAATHSFTGKFYLCILFDTENIILHYPIIIKRHCQFTHERHVLK